MKQLPLFIVLVTMAAYTHGQDAIRYRENPLDDRYYPENKLIRENRIRYIIDSSEFIKPEKFSIRVYDTAGRWIGDTRGSVDSFSNPFVYSRRGDTLTRIQYLPGTTELRSFARYIYNKKGLITSYLECGTSYADKTGYYVFYEEFVYGKNGQLANKPTYYTPGYPGKLSGKDITPDKLELVDAVQYGYKTLANGKRLVIGRHTVGDAAWRRTDSTIYDSRGRVIRSSAYAHRGALGEMLQTNVNDITEVTYTDSSARFTVFTTYCQSPISHYRCLQYAQTDAVQRLVVYNKDNTQKIVYGFLAGGEKYVVSKYQYIRY